ncbi:MAG: hypothetical protein Q8O94_04050, partial [bacterium]|nr:hypothetical protein [bacterium]
VYYDYMKKIVLVSIVFSGVMAFPSISSAQTPFGGLEIVMLPCTCSGMALHFFGPVYLGTAVPVYGYFVAPYTPTLYLHNYLHPGAWALGFYTPGVQSCLMIAYPCTVFPVLGLITPATGTSL